MTERWRTQLRDERGEILQDLLFTGAQETDYFVDEGRAVSFPGEAAPFREDRTALIEDFLKNDNLSRRNNVGINGQTVISIYTESKTLDNQPDIETALKNFQNPFTADLHPVAQALRTDFDATTNIPIATVTVNWDAAGHEYIVAYRTLSAPEILSSISPAEKDALFKQDIPAEAFIESRDLSQDSLFLTDIEEISRNVDYPLFVSSNIDQGLKLVSSVLTLPKEGIKLPNGLSTLSEILASGSGVLTTYQNDQSGAQIIIVQGTAERLGPALKNMRPTWTSSKQKTIRVGNNSYAAWNMKPDESSVIYIIDTGQTMIYVEAASIASADIEDFLRTLQAVH